MSIADHSVATPRGRRPAQAQRGCKENFGMAMADKVQAPIQGSSTIIDGVASAQKDEQRLVFATIPR
jgi:hypothetical protein